MVRTCKKIELFTLVNYEKVTPNSHFSIIDDAVTHFLQQEELRTR